VSNLTFLPLKIFNLIVEMLFKSFLAEPQKLRIEEFLLDAEENSLAAFAFDSIVELWLES
jgi:hypothetical protein